jgi:hypothetical protein
LDQEKSGNPALDSTLYRQQAFSAYLEAIKLLRTNQKPIKCVDCFEH